MPSIRKKPQNIHPHPHRFLMGVGVLLTAFFVYLPGSPWPAARIALAGTVHAAMSTVLPPSHATILLDVPYHHQEHPLSCEIASLRSALLSVHLDVPESILLSALPMDETPKSVPDASGMFTWGDPDEGFVGSINGRMPSTGYGIHAAGLAKVASIYAVTVPMRSDDAPAVIRALAAGHPVIAWYALGRNPQSLVWTTPAGKTIHGALYEHTVVIAGYRGSAGQIDAVFLMDPLSGMREEPWDAFVRRTALLDHQALELQPVVF